MTLNLSWKLFLTGISKPYELHTQNSRKLDNIAEKVIKQEVEIKVIQGGKK